MISHYMTL